MNKQINISEALDWYLWAGVSETCSDFPCLKEEKNTTLIPESPINTVLSSQITQKNIPHYTESYATSIKNAKDVCEKAKTLLELKEILQNFEGCALKKTAASTVLGDGCPTAKIMLIGEAPGADEDRIGKPFVGRCGKLLDKMLSTININRADCYITNVLPWRPPGNRTPTDEEIAICMPFLKRQIELINPDILLLLGGIAFKSVMDTNDSISRARGKWLEYTIYENKSASVLATYHPSYLLRSPAQKAKTWSDLLRLKKKISSNL